MATERTGRSLQASRGNNALTTPSQVSLVIETVLRVTALALRAELTPDEVRLWKVLLQSHPAPAIQWAFQEIVKTADFFPRPAEILTLIAVWSRAERERLEAERKRTEAAETEARRARGETWGLANVWTKFKEIMDRKTMEPVKKPTAVKNRALMSEDYGRRDPNVERARLAEYLKQHPEIGAKA